MLVAQSVQSIGDAMREIDAKGLLRSDFILVRGDLVSNINIEPILTRHK